MSSVNSTLPEPKIIVLQDCTVVLGCYLMGAKYEWTSDERYHDSQARLSQFLYRQSTSTSELRIH